MGLSDGPGGTVGEKPMAIRMAEREDSMRKVKLPTWNSPETISKANDRGLAQRRFGPEETPVLAKYKGREIRAASDAMRVQQSDGKKVSNDLIKPVIRGFDPKND